MSGYACLSSFRYNEMPVTNRLDFGFEEVGKRKRLTVGMPSVALEQLLGKEAIDDGGLYVSQKRILHTERENSRSKVGFNFAVVGRLTANNKVKAMSILHNIFGSIARLANGGEVEHDEHFMLHAYHSSEGKPGLRQCVMDVAKPKKTDERIGHIVKSFMADSAFDLRLVPEASRDSYHARAAVAVDWQEKHVSIGWGGAEALRSVAFAEDGERARLAGEVPAATALTHMAGAVALATYR